ncbi:MAG: rRNA maturation RNase YbeY [Chloroflexi bacterium]|nr:rRNA maturation RNase YbeY [Chloroflexota bacterium]
MIHLLVSDPFLDQVDLQKLEQAAAAALNHEEIDPESDLTLVVEDDAYLQVLNKEYLGIDAPTDVLSFPAGEGEIDPDSGHVYLGDIILSYPRAAEQAAAAGHPPMNEMQLLVVHGVLHLLGHDHAEENEKAQMWAAQQAILDRLGVQINRLPE